MRVKKLEMYPVECVVRGYLVGLRAGRSTANPAASAGSSCRPASRESEQLPEPIFTPATKADVGEHDENIDFDRAAEIIGSRAADGGAAPRLDRALRARRGTRRGARDHPRRHQVRVRLRRRATEVVLGDEVLTPDSSRFWPADAYEPGSGQASFDKQYVRDWLDEQGWDRKPPAPRLPEDVIAGTRAKYLEAYKRISGRELA